MTNVNTEKVLVELKTGHVSLVVGSLVFDSDLVRFLIQLLLHVAERAINPRAATCDDLVAFRELGNLISLLLDEAVMVWLSDYELYWFRLARKDF